MAKLVEHPGYAQAAFNPRDGWFEASARADAAALVRDRVAEFPNTALMPAGDLEVSVVRDFLTAEQCATLMALIDANRMPSPVVSDDPVPAYRTSETCYLYSVDPIVAAVEARLDALLGIDPIHGELLQGQR